MKRTIPLAKIANHGLMLSVSTMVTLGVTNFANHDETTHKATVQAATVNMHQTLQNAINTGKQYTRKYYTAASFNRLQNALMQAQQINSNSRSTTTQLNTALATLNAAMNQIQRLPVAPIAPAVKANLQNTLGRARTYTAKYYTATSYARLQKAINDAQAILYFWPATTSQYQKTIADLNNAMQAIVWLPANKTDLQATINAAKEFTLAFYTSDSVAKLVPALNEAIRINADNDVQMWPVIQATRNLQQAIQQMTRQPRTRAELTSLLQQAEQVVKFPGTWKAKASDKFGTWYTQASVNALASQLPMVIQAYTNRQAPVADVTNAYIWLTKTINNLVPSMGPYMIQQPAPVTMSVLTFKNNPTIFTLPNLYGRNGQVQVGNINWHINVTTKIKGQEYNLITNLTNALKVMTPGQYTLTYTINGGSGNNAITTTMTRVINLTADGQNNFNNPMYHFGLIPTIAINRDPHMYSTLPYAQLATNPVLYDNNNAIVDPQAYRVNYQIMLGQQAYGLFDKAVDYALPGSYRVKFAATGMYTGRALTTFTQTMKLNAPDNRNVLNPQGNYQFVGLTPTTISGSDYQAILKSGDNGDASFDPFYGVGLVDNHHQAITDYGTVNVYSDWANIDFGQGNYAAPGQYQVKYYAIAADGHMVATGTRSVTIIK
ncbi:hypothetical protein [Periweissella fabalis]|uniref:Uncharacterized protein n=1 Tax=Periweissella fabalis TaxID=1070421 RepID=A0A7X6MZU3_9LACO|nr:hypothetical protein [Periweissella fabalis]MCM0598921.1 hypothetical protein [Periweissella fabalis]NKZ23201.1 hypothetical protein [Periweissella fabalis]